MPREAGLEAGGATRRGNRVDAVALHEQDLRPVGRVRRLISRRRGIRQPSDVPAAGRHRVDLRLAHPVRVERDRAPVRRPGRLRVARRVEVICVWPVPSAFITQIEGTPAPTVRETRSSSRPATRLGLRPSRCRSRGSSPSRRPRGTTKMSPSRRRTPPSSRPARSSGLLPTKPVSVVEPPTVRILIDAESKAICAPPVPRWWWPGRPTRRPCRRRSRSRRCRR